MNSTVKKAFAEEVTAYERTHGKMYFAFDDIHLPVKYRSLTGVLSTEVAGEDVAVVVDYSLDLEDNLQRLLDVLLEKHPSLTN